MNHVFHKPPFSCNQLMDPAFLGVRKDYLCRTCLCIAITLPSIYNIYIIPRCSLLLSFLYFFSSLFSLSSLSLSLSFFLSLFHSPLIPCQSNLVQLLLKVSNIYDGFMYDRLCSCLYNHHQYAHFFALDNLW